MHKPIHIYIIKKKKKEASRVAQPLQAPGMGAGHQSRAHGIHVNVDRETTPESPSGAQAFVNMIITIMYFF